MSQAVFKTFNNTPKSNKNNTFQSVSAQEHETSFHNAQDLKNQIQQILHSKNSRKSHKKTKKTRARYSTDISLMMSDVSMPNYKDDADIPFSLLSLQVQVTEQILSLKEDKLTLLDEYNKSLGSRFKVERQLVKIKKNESEKQRESSSVGGQAWLPDFQSSPSVKNHSETTHPIIVKNQALKKQYHSLNIGHKRENSDTSEFQWMNELQILQQKSAVLEEQLKKIDQKADKINQQRFQTFFPTKSTASQKNKKISQQKRKLESLKREREELYKQIAHKNNGSKFSHILIHLLQENEHLQMSSDALLSKKIQNKKIPLNVLVEKLEKISAENQMLMKQIQKVMLEAERIGAQNLKMGKYRY